MDEGYNPAKPFPKEAQSMIKEEIPRDLLGILREGLQTQTCQSWRFATHRDMSLTEPGYSQSLVIDRDAYHSQSLAT